MQQDCNCRVCGIKLHRTHEAIKTPNISSGRPNLYFCFTCAREIAKAVLVDADLEEFGQELVMDKLSNENE